MGLLAVADLSGIDVFSAHPAGVSAAHGHAAARSCFQALCRRTVWSEVRSGFLSLRRKLQASARSWKFWKLVQKGQPRDLSIQEIVERCIYALLTQRGRKGPRRRDRCACGGYRRNLSDGLRIPCVSRRTDVLRRIPWVSKTIYDRGEGVRLEAGSAAHLAAKERA